MTTFISIQNTYKRLELALFNNATLVDIRFTKNQQATKEFVPLLQDLLKTNHQLLEGLSCIVTNQGPGPFSTLRAVIASVNGLCFAVSLPLIGVDGLYSFIKEQHDVTYPYTVVLLNAFNFSVYFALQQPEKRLVKGYKKIDQLLFELKKIVPGRPIRFLGSATQLYKDKILNIFNSCAYIPSSLPLAPSIEGIAAIGLQKWKKQENISNQLMPLYLKKYSL